MDPNGNLYEAHSDLISAEDKARLDGYLKARAEADRDAHAEHLAEMEALLQAKADETSET